MEYAASPFQHRLGPPRTSSPESSIAEPTEAEHCESPARVAVVILNLDDGLSTLRLLDTLKASRNRLYDLEVVVVDNGSLDDSAVAIAEALTRFDHAHLIANSANRGSAEGRNQAIRFLLERDPKQQPDYILTLDNDTLLDPGVIDGLVSHALASPPHEVAFAPLMFFADEPQRR